MRRDKRNGGEGEGREERGGSSSFALGRKRKVGAYGWGWGIWHILCMKDHFSLPAGGLKPEQGRGAEPPDPSLELCSSNYNVAHQFTVTVAFY